MRLMVPEEEMLMWKRWAEVWAERARDADKRTTDIDTAWRHQVTGFALAMVDNDNELIRCYGHRLYVAANGRTEDPDFEPPRAGL